MNYLVYKITNKVNEKIYIGKTKEYYKNNEYGIDGRFTRHLQSANSSTNHSNDCPRLYNAIRKYGKDNFMIEILETTTEDKIDEREIYHIKTTNSTDDNIGYNIALGGGGRKVVNVDEDVRMKISKAQCKTGIMGIKPYYDNDIHIGYYARRRESGKVLGKYFTSTEYTVEENLQKAKEWMESVKQNKIDNSNKYNKKSNLPTNINYIKDKVNKELVIGYRVDILKNGIKILKSFQSKNGNLEEQYNKAINFKNNIINAK